MLSKDIGVGLSYVAKLPHHNQEVRGVVTPLAYYGSDKWKVHFAETNQVHYVNSENIIRLAIAADRECILLPFSTPPRQRLAS